jgi:hypothetical protein
MYVVSTELLTLLKRIKNEWKVPTISFDEVFFSSSSIFDLKPKNGKEKKSTKKLMDGRERRNSKTTNPKRDYNLSSNNAIQVPTYQIHHNYEILLRETRTLKSRQFNGDRS